jgi:hypothetical protein
VQSQFPASVYIIWKAKNLVKEQDTVSSPVPKPRRTFFAAVLDAVKKVLL